MFIKFLCYQIIFFQSLINAYPSNENQIQCSSSYCSNGNGICLMENNQQTCYCLPEWEGEFCQFTRKPSKNTQKISRINTRNTPCSYVPTLCQNQGVCYVNDDKKVACQCPDPYDGARCQEYSVCYNYCFNGKICSTTGDGKDKKPTCDCGEDFEGDRCQVKITTTVGPTTTTTTTTVSTTTDVICTFLPDGYCNTGSCVVINNLAVCQCPPTHSGDQCQNAIGGTPAPGQTNPPIIPGQTNPPIIPGQPSTTLFPGQTNPPQAGITCAQNPCRNNRPCYNNGNSYFCYCGTQFSGPNCEVSLG